jgi:hypothetical protein
VHNDVPDRRDETDPEYAIPTRGIVGLQLMKSVKAFPEHCDEILDIRPGDLAGLFLKPL